MDRIPEGEVRMHIFFVVNCFVSCVNDLILGEKLCEKKSMYKTKCVLCGEPSKN